MFMFWGVCVSVCLRNSETEYMVKVYMVYVKVHVCTCRGRGEC